MTSLNSFLLTTVFLASYVQSQPAIVTVGNDMTLSIDQGGSVSVNAGGDIVQLYPAPINPVITSDVAKLTSDAKVLQETVDAQQVTISNLLAALELLQTKVDTHTNSISAQQTTSSNLQTAQELLQKNVGNHASSILNLTELVESNLNKIERNGEAQGETEYALDELAREVKKVFATTNASTDALDELSDLVDKVRHPETQVVYGDYVVGDDRISSAVCRAGLTLTQCSVDLKPGSTDYRLDGMKYVSTSLCQAVSSGSGVSIRVKAECSNLHTDTKVAHYPPTGFLQKNVTTTPLTCPDGYRALSCSCWSPWSFCSNDGFGFSPSTTSTCTSSLALFTPPSNRPDVGVLITALCVRNE